MTRECANCGTPYAGLHVFTFAAHPVRSRCRSCSADLVNREHFRIWKRNFTALAVLAGAASWLFLGPHPAAFLLATVAVASYVVFPFKLPVNRF